MAVAIRPTWRFLPDGRFVTSEKGIPRIKIYTGLGEFECVVAGPQELGISLTAVGDARYRPRQQNFRYRHQPLGQVLVLDPAGRRVRVFSPSKKQESAVTKVRGRE